MPNAGAVKILLVEDNRADADLVCDFVKEKFPSDIDVVEDGEKALRYLSQKDEYSKEDLPDLVLLDLNIPKVHGREVLRAVKMSETLKSIPVLVFTSSGAEADVLESYRLNANCYLQKPKDLDQFSQLVELLVEFWIKTVKIPTKYRRREHAK